MGAAEYVTDNCSGGSGDNDNDGTPDDEDECDDDPNKITAGVCGCGVPEEDQCNNRPQTALMMTPADAAIDVSLTPTLSIDAFQDSDEGDAHAKTIWQISKIHDFSVFAVNETSEEHLISFTVQKPLETETTYYWRTSCVDNRGGHSEWSKPFSFTTKKGDAPEVGGGGGGGGGCFINAVKSDPRL